MGKCAGPTGGTGICPDNRSGLGVRKHGEEWRCEKCHKESDVHADDTDAPPRDITINELLCFISNQTESLSGTDLVKICLNFYDETEIATARRLMFDTYTGDKTSLKLNTDSANLSENYLHDMYDLMKTANNEDLPTFVARNLLKIPTTKNADNIDIVSLFNDVSRIRHQLDTLTRNTGDEFKRVRREMHGPGTSKVPRRTAPPALPKLAPPTTRRQAPPPEREPPSLRPAQPTTASDIETIDTNNAENQDSDSGQHNKTWSDDIPEESDLEDDQNAQTGSKRQSYAEAAAKKPERSRSIVASGTNKRGLRASTWERPDELFVSYLDPDTTNLDLQNYIKTNIGCGVTCEKVDTNYDDEFASYKVFVGKRFVENFFNPDNWPKKVRIEYYRPPRRRRTDLRRNVQQRNQRRNNSDYRNRQYPQRRNNHNGNRDNDNEHYERDSRENFYRHDRYKNDSQYYDSRNETDEHYQRSTDYELSY